ncbi:hypothetical protein KEJ14_04290 [Candidatus Bathyarchaeota archaeon]|nr:hypothetical protein [Candidatus Bathyarchaeota archaeon]
MRRIKVFCLHLLMVLLGIMVILSASSIGLSETLTGLNYLPVIERARIDYELVKEIVANITSFGSRYTTYSGYEKTAVYIKEWFQKYLEPFEGEWSQKYNLTVLIDYGGSLTLSNGLRLKAYPLMPNEIAPVYVKNLTAPIVYVGSGELHELNGKPINGSIVVMDFNSNWRWLRVASLGAKAVIFLEPSQTSRAEALQKRLEKVPYSFPRFYLQRDEAIILLKEIFEAEKRGETLMATLEGRTMWENREAENIMGFLKSPGKYSNTWVILCAYFDAYSVVPSLSFGASEAISPAILMALAKYYSENPPEYSILFVVFSGHNQGLWGAIEWVEKYAYGPDHPPDSPYYRSRSIGHNVSAAIQIDVTPDTPIVYPFPGQVGGYYCAQRGGTFGDPARLFSVYKDIMSQTGIDYGIISQGENQEAVLSNAFGAQTTRPILTPMYMRWVETEIFSCGGMPELPSVQLSTGRTLSAYYAIPIDTYKTIEPSLPNIKSQMEQIYAWLHFYLHSDVIENLYPPGSARWAVSCTRGDGSMRAAHTYLFHVELQAVVWNYSVGWYTPAPKFAEGQKILFIWYGAGGNWESGEIYYSYRALRIMLADDEGRFNQLGVRYGESYGVWRARVLDSEGRVIGIDDFGQYSLAQRIVITDSEWNVARAKNLENSIMLPVFKCAGAIILDFIIPDYLDLSYISPTISVRYFEGHTSAVHVSAAAQGGGREYHFLGYSVAAAFFETEKPIEILMLMSYAANRPHAILINSTINNPAGSGYKLRMGEQIVFSIFDFARSLYYVNEERARVLFATVGRIGSAAELHEKTSKLIQEMDDALKNYRYSEAHVKAVEAWKIARDSYSIIRGSIEGAIYTVPFFSALIIPFVLLAEKMIFESHGVKRLLITLAMCAGIIAFFSLLHPGFVLASSSIVVLLSFAILALLLPAILVILDRTSRILTELRRKALGAEYAAVGRATFFLSSLSTGIGYMRRRRLRTILTMISICILVFAVVIFTSISGIQATKMTELPKTVEPPYEGILMHKEYFGQALEGYLYGIGINILDYLQSKYGDEAYIAPRVWIWPQHGSLPAFAPYGGFLITGPKYPEYKPYVVRALLALTPQEESLTRLRALLLGGRWFNEGDRYSIILTEQIASKLGIKPEDLPVKVNLSGLELTCIGIMSDELTAVAEMDGTMLTPIDFSVAVTPPVQLYSWQIAIVPYKLWPDLDAYYQSGARCALMIASIGMKFHDPSRIEEVAKEIFSLFPAANMQLWVYSRNRLYQLTLGSSIVSIGWREHAIPIVIVGLTILNLMFANVVDRRRDIMTFSSVGLSPLHVSLMFFAESTVYGIVGSICGYLVAVTIVKVASLLGFGTILFNYASEWVAMALMISIGITALSSIYPAIIAARIVTPSLERKWAVKTKPVGNEWDIPLPFVANSDKEALATLIFLKEYIDKHLSPVSPEFSTERLSEISRTKIKDYYNAFILSVDVRIMPYELGIRQTMLIQLMEVAPERWPLTIHLTRKSGDIKEWERRNRDFIDYIRKRLLVWKSLPSAEKETYLHEAEKFT